NIVGVADFGELPDGRFFLVMEYVHGRSLRQELDEIDPDIMGLRRSLVLLKQICNALTTAHDAGVVHRSVQPANVLLTRSPSGEEQVKLVDFGLAKRVKGHGRDSLTENRPIIGDPRYFAPEHLLGSPVDSRVDVFSVGVLAYEMLTGDLPFPGRNMMQVVALHQQGPAPELADMRPADAPKVPSSLERVLMSCLSIDREERPRHIADVVEAILMTLPRVPDEVREGRRHTITRVSGSSDEAARWVKTEGEGGRAGAPSQKRSAKRPASPPPPPPQAARRAAGERPAGSADPALDLARTHRSMRAPVPETSAGTESEPEGFDVDLDLDGGLGVGDQTQAGVSLDDFRVQIWNNINTTAAALVKLLQARGLCSTELSGYLEASRNLEEQEVANDTEIAVLKDRLDETDTRWRQRTGPLRDALLNLRQARGRLAEDESTNAVILDTLDQQIADLEERLGEATDELEELQREIENYLRSRQEEQEALQRKLGENQLIILQLLRFLKRPDFPREALEAYVSLEEMLRNVQADA
ncbi:MAG: protein kinase, partial [Polyangia bacterium]|nr:protein kinase [Polyangia bacterium]